MKMIVPYDVNFDEKVDRCAEALEVNFKYANIDYRFAARVVLLEAMAVDAELKKKEN